MRAPPTTIDAYLDRAASRAEATPGDAQLARYLRWLPVLWLLGLHVVVLGALTLRLAWRRWTTDGVVNLLFAAWTLAALAQAAAVVYNWSLTDEGFGQLAARLFSFTVLGWLFLGSGLVAGRSWELAGPVVVRAFMRVGLYIVSLTVLCYAVSIPLGIQGFAAMTPVRALLGNRPTADFYSLAIFFHKEESSFGLVRLVLFYPWSTCLSLMGIVMLAVTTCETDRAWRAAGVAGGLCAVAFSFSRAGYATLPVALAVTYAVRGRPAALALALMGACAVGLACLLFDVSPVRVVDALVTGMRESRAGSSQARDLVYEASWAGFEASPLFGQGWIGDSVIAQENLPVGSHSTVYGVLYTGGLATFGCVALAGLSTLLATVAHAVRTRAPAPAAGAGIMTALVIFSYGEGLSTLVLPLLTVFLFVGGSLSPAAGEGGVP